MLKFFRRIRHQLLQQNKFNSYVIYAIGEILLVVIGILIALQINNWNEDRKNATFIESLMDKVEQDLLANIHRANTTFNFSPVAIQLKGSFIDGRWPFFHSIEPNSFIVLSHIPQPIHNDNTRVVELMSNGECETKYMSRKNSYLFIE